MLKIVLVIVSSALQSPSVKHPCDRGGRGGDGGGGKHMRRLIEEHEYVLQSYWAQRFREGQGGERKETKGVKIRIGGEVVI